MEMEGERERERERMSVRLFFYLPFTLFLSLLSFPLLLPLFPLFPRDHWLLPPSLFSPSFLALCKSRDEPMCFASGEKKLFITIFPLVAKKPRPKRERGKKTSLSSTKKMEEKISALENKRVCSKITRFEDYECEWHGKRGKARGGREGARSEGSAVHVVFFLSFERKKKNCLIAWRSPRSSSLPSLLLFLSDALLLRSRREPPCARRPWRPCS